MHFPKNGCANMLLVLESSPNLVKPQLHPKNKLMNQKKWKTIQSQTWAINPAFTPWFRGSVRIGLM